MRLRRFIRLTTSIAAICWLGSGICVAQSVQRSDADDDTFRSFSNRNPPSPIELLQRLNQLPGVNVDAQQGPWMDDDFREWVQKDLLPNLSADEREALTNIAQDMIRQQSLGQPIGQGAGGNPSPGGLGDLESAAQELRRQLSENPDLEQSLRETIQNRGGTDALDQFLNRPPNPTNSGGVGNGSSGDSGTNSSPNGQGSRADPDASGNGGTTPGTSSNGLRPGDGDPNNNGQGSNGQGSNGQGSNGQGSNGQSAGGQGTSGQNPNQQNRTGRNPDNSARRDPLRQGYGQPIPGGNRPGIGSLGNGGPGGGQSGVGDNPGSPNAGSPPGNANSNRLNPNGQNPGGVGQGANGQGRSLTGEPGGGQPRPNASSNPRPNSNGNGGRSGANSNSPPPRNPAIGNSRSNPNAGNGRQPEPDQQGGRLREDPDASFRDRFNRILLDAAQGSVQDKASGNGESGDDSRDSNAMNELLSGFAKSFQDKMNTPENRQRIQESFRRQQKAKQSGDSNRMRQVFGDGQSLSDTSVNTTGSTIVVILIAAGVVVFFLTRTWRNRVTQAISRYASVVAHAKAFRLMNIGSPKELVDAVDRFVFWKYGHGAHWWHGGLVKRQLIESHPQLRSEIGSLLGAYETARYAPDRNLDASELTATEATLHQLLEISKADELSKLSGKVPPYPPEPGDLQTS